MRENMSARKCCRGLNARKFSCAKICTFTVYKIPGTYQLILISLCHRFLADADWSTVEQCVKIKDPYKTLDEEVVHRSEILKEIIC